jgi:hypothetical protein
MVPWVRNVVFFACSTSLTAPNGEQHEARLNLWRRYLPHETFTSHKEGVSLPTH